MDSATLQKQYEITLQQIEKIEGEIKNATKKQAVAKLKDEVNRLNKHLKRIDAMFYYELKANNKAKYNRMLEIIKEAESIQNQKS